MSIDVVEVVIWRESSVSGGSGRSEERFSRNAETDLVCRLLLEKKNSPPGTGPSPTFGSAPSAPPASPARGGVGGEVCYWGREAAGAAGGDLRGAGAGDAGLRGEERVQGGADRDQRRHRQRADGVHRGGCARAGAGGGGLDAFGLLVAGDAERCPSHREEPGRAVPRASDPGDPGRLRRGAQAGIRGPAAGHHGGEPSGAGARQYPDGAFEQAWLSGPDDR